MEIDLKNYNPDVRHVNDMEEVMYDQAWVEDTVNTDLYYMYRKLKIENELRYDITIIPPKMLGQEFVKTKGHIHQGFYGEVYMVLEGEGIYLAQKGDENNIEDVVVTHGKTGDVILIPAGYGHVTINPGKGQLKTANWIAERDQGDFSLFERNQGACYYYIAAPSTGSTSSLQAGSGQAGQWIKNPRYQNVPELRFEEPLKEVPQNLDFLKAK